MLELLLLAVLMTSEIETTFEVKLKKNGKIISRHVWATGEDGAVAKCAGKKHKDVRVIGVKKVRPEDVIGDLKLFKKLSDIVGKIPPKFIVAPIINEDTTLDSIIFGKKGGDRAERIRTNEKFRVKDWLK